MNKKSLLLLLILFFGCSPLINQGKVISKAYFPAWNQITPNRVDREVSVSHSIVHKGKWVITISQEDAKTGKVKTRAFSVSKKEFKQIKIGAWVSIEHEKIKIIAH